MNGTYPPRTKNNMTSEITIKGDTVTKRITIPRLGSIEDRAILDKYEKECFYREVHWLTLFDGSIAPKLLNVDSMTLTLTMEYRGRPVTEADKIGDNFDYQLVRIMGELLKNRCYYNDWKDSNLLMDDNGLLTLIDFGWCPLIVPDYSVNGMVLTDLKEKPGGEVWM